jgi:hypothetical protein
MASIANTMLVSPSSISLVLKRLLERPISALPSRAALMPAPEPVASYVTVMTGFTSAKASIKEAIVLSTEVEPFVDTVPLTSDEPLEPQPVNKATDNKDTSNKPINFFMMLSL